MEGGATSDLAWPRHPTVKLLFWVHGQFRTAEGCEYEREYNRKRKRVANMLPERLEAERKRKRVAAMTPERIEARREQWRNTSPQQREDKNARLRAERDRQWVRKHHLELRLAKLALRIERTDNNPYEAAQARDAHTRLSRRLHAERSEQA